jgi:phage tail-like protein
LNRDGLWPGFTWEGLELDADGVLRLMALPRVMGSLPLQVGRLASVQPAAGIAVDAEGTIYFSDPAANRMYRLDACSKQVEPMPGLAGAGSAPGRLSAPAGLVIPAHRRALYVADSGNGRIQILDLGTGAVLEILTGFDLPVSLACDDDGQLYVVDVAAKRVDQLTVSGDVVPSFWSNVRAGGHVAAPVAVACPAEWVYVLDGQTHNVEIFNRQGTWIRSISTSIDGAIAFAACDSTIYVGDPGRRRLVVFCAGQDGAFVNAGDADGYDGPVAALVCEPEGRLLLSPGGGVVPLTLDEGASFRHEGWLRSGPISVDGIPHFWNRVHADIELPDRVHVQFYVYAGDPSAPPPPASDPVPAAWRAAGSGASDFFLTFDGTKTTALWIAARFDNDAQSTPSLSQLRVDFDQESYLPYLPAIFRQRNCSDVLLRYLSLFESFFGELEGEIDRLPALVDPAAARADALAWLAGFLALRLPEAWSEAQQREAIARAYDRYARRGTVAGLREAIWLEAGVRVTIDEPLQNAGWWSMPGTSTSCKAGAGGWTDGGDSILGLNTVLASSEPQGAVVGTSAVLDRSQLLSEEEYGTPLFEALAYRFTLQLFPGDVDCAGALDRIRAIVDREKPAHTSYDVCVVEPGIRVGYRARLGVDTLLGSGPVHGRLGETGLVLAGQPPSHLGVGSQLGVSTHL